MRHADDSRFFRVERATHTTSEGPVELPILYYDVTNVVAMFWGDRAAAERLAAEAGLELAMTRGERALVGLSFFEYRRTTVGVYNEVGTAIFCVPPGQRPSRVPGVELYAPPAWRKVGAYVVDLPVTTPAANAAGRELWGYPKFVTDIPFQLDGRRFESSVLDPDDGSLICELAGTIGRGVPAPPMSLVTYTRLGDELLRTHVDVRGIVRACRPGSLQLRVGDSTHRMADNLRSLGLDAATPIAVTVAPRFQSILHAGTRVSG